MPAGQEMPCNGSKNDSTVELSTNSVWAFLVHFVQFRAQFWPAAYRRSTYPMRSRMVQFSAQSAERERRTAHILVLLDVVIVWVISSPHFGPLSFLQLFLWPSFSYLCAFSLHRLSSNPIGPRCAAALLSIACSRYSEVILRASFRGRLADPRA